MAEARCAVASKDESTAASTFGGAEGTACRRFRLAGPAGDAWSVARESVVRESVVRARRSKSCAEGEAACPPDVDTVERVVASVSGHFERKAASQSALLGGSPIGKPSQRRVAVCSPSYLVRHALAVGHDDEAVVAGTRNDMAPCDDAAVWAGLSRTLMAARAALPHGDRPRCRWRAAAQEIVAPAAQAAEGARPARKAQAEGLPRP